MGYPRKIAVACHNALELAVMRERTPIDEPMVLEVIRGEVI
jgi:hypothetical protein